jgi:hypothetical protein
VSNYWFPRLRNDGVVASGNTSIWLTAPDGTAQEGAAVGGWPVWAGQTLVYDLRDGRTQVGRSIVAQEYNEYAGSDIGQWAGFVAGNPSRVDRYDVNIANTEIVTLLESIPTACAPRFYGGRFGYLTPYHENVRTLVVGGAHVTGPAVITDWCADKGGACYLYTVAVGTYARRIFDHRGDDVTVRPQLDETPYVVLVGPDGHPWMVSWTPTHTFVRMVYQAAGYAFDGDFLNADARVIGNRMHVVGSTSNGQLREAWIDFAQPRVDLRTV